MNNLELATYYKKKYEKLDGYIELCSKCKLIAVIRRPNYRRFMVLPHNMGFSESYEPSTDFSEFCKCRPVKYLKKLTYKENCKDCANFYQWQIGSDMGGCRLDLHEDGHFVNGYCDKFKRSES